MSLERQAKPRDAGRVVGRGASAGRGGAGTETPSAPRRPDCHPAVPTGTHHQGAKSLVCLYKLAWRTGMLEPIQNGRSHI